MTEMHSTMTPITQDRVAELLSRHASLYRQRAPTYQTVMLQDLARIWQDYHAMVLDVGGGTGLMAEAIQTFLPVGKVTAVDVVDRYCVGLSIETAVYNGSRLPYDDSAFDAATINNVLHHVPVEVRGPLMREIRRVVAGPIYIKDHIAASRLDHWRLTALDAIGNLPFGGQIEAGYLSADDWKKLAANCECAMTAPVQSAYRSGGMAVVFPNRLEATFRFDPC